MSIADKIYLRQHLLTNHEADWVAGSGNAFVLFIAGTLAGTILPLGLVGSGYLVLNGEWVLPWGIVERLPWLLIPCGLFGFWMGYAIFLKPFLTGRAKLNKLIQNTITQVDIDAWTKEVTGQIFRTANGGAPIIMNDLTLETTMADAMFKGPA